MNKEVCERHLEFTCEAAPRMEDNKIPDRLADWQPRRYRRYDLEFPVRMIFQNGAVVTELEGVSKNVSVGGLLVRSATPLPQHTSIRFTLIVHGKNAVRPVHLVGEGEVVRVVTSTAAGGAFLMAVRCSTTVTQLEEYLSQAC